MPIQQKSQAGRRYRRRFAIAMGLYVVLIMGVSFLFGGPYEPKGPLAWLVALLPGLAIVGVIVAMGLYLKEEKDEFERAVLVESMLWGIGAVTALCSIWGLLEIYVGAPHLWIFMVGPIFCVAFGVAQPLIRWRYR